MSQSPLLPTEPGSNPLALLQSSSYSSTSLPSLLKPQLLTARQVALFPLLRSVTIAVDFIIAPSIKLWRWDVDWGQQHGGQGIDRGGGTTRTSGNDHGRRRANRWW